MESHEESYETPRTFRHVFKAELSDVRRRRRAVAVGPSADDSDPRDDLVGLALSGGGIRSATFSLGVLQGLRRHGLLRCFDYLSTVSGGGYAGGCWSAWLSRGCLALDNLRPPDLASFPKVRVRKDRGLCCEGEMAESEWERLRSASPEPAWGELVDRLHQRSPGFLPPERIEPQRAAEACEEPEDVGAAGGPAPSARWVGSGESSLNAGTDPVHHLRLFSNYLTPRKGLLSADTWRAVAVVTRNLAFTWLILVPLLFAAVALGQLYFVAHPWSGQGYARREAAAMAVATQPAARPSEAAEDWVARLKPSFADLLRAHEDGRLGAMAWPLGMLLGWIVWMSLLWMLRLKRGWIDGGTVVCVFTVACVAWAAGAGGSAVNGGPLVKSGGTWLLGTVLLTAYALRVERDVLSAWMADAAKCMPQLPPESGPQDAPRPEAPGTGRPRGMSAVRDALRRGTGTVSRGAGRAARRTWWLVRWLRKWIGYREPLTIARGQAVREVHRNQIVRVHAILLVVFVVLAVVLAVAGFGRDLAVGVWRTASAVGWATVLASAAGTAFTAIRLAPTGGGDRPGAPPGLASRLVIRVAPALLVACLLLGVAWASHEAICWIVRAPASRLPRLTLAVYGGIALALYLTWHESSRGAGAGEQLFMPAVLSGVVAALAVNCAGLWTHSGQHVGGLHYMALIDASFVSGMVFFAAIANLLSDPRAPARRPTPRRPRAVPRPGPRAVASGARKLVMDWVSGRLTFSMAVSIAALWACFFVLGWWVIWRILQSPTSSPGPGQWYMTPTRFLMAFLALCGMLTVVLLFRSRGDSRRSMLLLSSACAGLCTLLFLSFFGTFDESVEAPVRWLGFYARSSLTADPTGGHPAGTQAAFVLAALAMTWVIGVGWAVDPNFLSLHAFYKARLTRAYLGASNFNRRLQPVEVTDAVANDDVSLCRVDNCARGGPYPLINTTLNLVGGRDLATAQRSSAAFLLSPRFCGSDRTGYRRTRRYMDGRMTLGTAVAISGAAVSPAMGSGSPTAATAMLLTLCNIRLGYWAPTPNRELWRSPHARLWPFYTLRESLSQTNDLSSYCYLSDGGHFDNTGLYALVQRACRYILVVDNGADPGRQFADLGRAIRRCRIDLGAEITIQPDAFTGRKGGRGHFVVGTVRYAPGHIESLTVPGPDGRPEPWQVDSKGEDPRWEGVIVWLKPSLTGDESLDVRQYGKAHGDFPQQSTGDQWFDEAQFESYRRLGEHSAEALAKAVDASEGDTCQRIFERARSLVGEAGRNDQ